MRGRAHLFLSLILVSNAAPVSGQTTGELRTLAGHRKGVHALAFSPDGKTLASGSAGFGPSGPSGQLILYETSHYQPVSSRKSARGVLSLTYSPDGETLAAGALDGTITLWDVASVRPRASLRNPVGACSLRYSTDGSTLVVGGVSGGIVNAYDARTLVPRWRHVFPGDEIVNIAPMRKRGAMAAASGSAVLLLDVGTGKAGARFKYGGDVSSLATSPDGSRLAASSLDETVPLRVWDVASRMVLLELDTNAAALAFSPDGQELIACGIGTYVEVWDILKKQRLRVLKGHAPRDRVRGGILWSLAATPTGKIVAAGGADETIMVWDISR